jgi:hypothetical protein
VKALQCNSVALMVSSLNHLKNAESSVIIPWKRIHTDNSTLEGADPGTEKHVIKIYRYEGAFLTIWITERTHEGWVKYFMSCPPIDVFEHLIGVQRNMGRRLAINRALNLVRSELSSRDLDLIKDLDMAFVEIGER